MAPPPPVRTLQGLPWDIQLLIMEAIAEPFKPCGREDYPEWDPNGPYRAWTYADPPNITSQREAMCLLTGLGATSRQFHAAAVPVFWANARFAMAHIDDETNHWEPYHHDTSEYWIYPVIQPSPESVIHFDHLKVPFRLHAKNIQHLTVPFKHWEKSIFYSPGVWPLYSLFALQTLTIVCEGTQSLCIEDGKTQDELPGGHSRLFDETSITLKRMSQVVDTLRDIFRPLKHLKNINFKRHPFDGGRVMNRLIDRNSGPFGNGNIGNQNVIRWYMSKLPEHCTGPPERRVDWYLDKEREARDPLPYNCSGCNFCGSGYDDVTPPIPVGTTDWQLEEVIEKLDNMVLTSVNAMAALTADDWNDDNQPGPVWSQEDSADAYKQIIREHVQTQFVP